HHRGHGISAPDGHQAEDNNHPPAKSVNKAKTHAQHQKEHESKKRRMKMRDKIMASLIVLAGLVTLISGSTLTADAAGIQAQKSIAINYDAIQAADIGNIDQSIRDIAVIAKIDDLKIVNSIGEIENINSAATGDLNNCARINISDYKIIDARINGLARIDNLTAISLIGEIVDANVITKTISA
ncbi:MAG TPA: hypothetical protein VJT74_06620, partial [Pyrinomonadaceae bacterium]|nr:hypothetical protein [Pyrinomonadaceae bacterium]